MKIFLQYYLLPFAFCFLPFAFVFAQQCNIIYVTPTGTGNGTQANPSSLANAFTLVSPTNSQIWLAVGNYTISDDLPMISGITLEGGFDPTNNWQKTNSQQTIITRDASNLDPNPNRIVAVECTGISNFSIHDVTIITSDAALGIATTTYGIHISNSSSYILSRLNITSGNATDGVDGVPGADGMNGANGQLGQPGDEDGGCCTGGGAGGCCSYPGSNAGGNGGDGGARGTGVCFGIGGTAPDGAAGQTGQGAGGGTGGGGGSGMCGLPFSIGCDQTPASIGADGANGADGADGADGANGIPAFGVYFIPGDGQDGAQGDHGGGGGGGGGGGSQGCLNTCFGNNNGAGPGGSGGGEGGQGGFGATGGTGGGGSFGIYINTNGTGTYLKDCFETSGLQGNGGMGGTPGGNGGGSSGGASSVIGCDIGTGGAGGNGGAGGKGGNGGNGAAGTSLPLFEDTAGTAIAQSDMRASVEPDIFVQNTGCTFHDIAYTTNATGIIQWFFDGGSDPLSGTGDSAETQYSTLGRHSITLVVDGVPYMFTDFTGIFSDGTPFLPTINGNDTVCPGSTEVYSATFPSAFTVLSYDWKMYNPGSTTPDQTGTSATFSYTFPSTTGTYMITLQTESQCCGWSMMDTFYVELFPPLTTDVFVTASPATVCAGETVTLFAVPLNGGTNPTYQWQVNGVNLGFLGNSISSSNFINGTVVEVIMTSSYPCPLNSPVTSLPVTITVNPLPVATCSSVGTYLGANTNFSASPSGNYTYYWDFGDGGIDTASSPSHLYGGTGTYTYSVSVTDSNGCTGVCTGTVNIVVAPYVNSLFNYNSNELCGTTTVSFTDNSQGSPTSWLWDFGDGTTDTVQNPNHTYTTPGTYSVTLISSNGVFSDTVLMANIITVKVVPDANISYITDTICYPLSAQFFDISSGAVSWQWDFGDGNTSTLQNPSHSYMVDGTYNVMLIVSSIDGCLDTAYSSVTVLPQPTALFVPSDTAICSGDSISFTDVSTNAVQWYWDYGDGNSDTGLLSSPHTYTDAGLFSVTLIVENSLGCTDTFPPQGTQILIDVKQQPDALFDPDTTTIIFPDNDIALTNLSTNYTSWVWDFGNGTLDSTNFNATAVYEDSGVYMIKLYAIYELGCKDTDSIEVTVIDIEAIYIPTAFTPGSDGTNDVFYIYGNGFTELKLIVFDRWGDAIFECNADVTQVIDGRFCGWDGKLKGARVPDGVYPYRVDYKKKSTKSKLQTKIGSVMVLGKK